MASIVTLTTDFGTSDWFVGTMKGVVAGLAPGAKVIDLTHAVPPGDIRAGSFSLAASYRYFPRRTVHVAVVDPGVGGARKAIAVQTANYFFVGPDNGVLSWALSKEKIRAIHALENEKYFLRPVSRTFHGRDVFVPVAAHLIRGVRIQKLGPRLKEVVRLARPAPRVRRGRIEGEVLYIDRFGNAITNIDAQMLQSPGRGRLSVLLRRKWLCPVADFYEAVPTGRPVAVPGSNGLLEIAVSGGSAVHDLGLRVGSAVQVWLRQERNQRKG